MRSFAELWRAPLKNQNMLTGSNMLCLGSLSELGEGQGRVECRYQGCVLLPCVSHLYVYHLRMLGHLLKCGRNPACKAKELSNQSTLGGRETQY